MQTARWTLARSPPGTYSMYRLLILTSLCKCEQSDLDAKYQSTNWIVRLVLIVATDALTSLGTTSPRYIMQHAIYFPCRGSHFAIMLEGSKALLVISATDNCSW